MNASASFFAPLGTVSAGTLAMPDLASAFVHALCRLARLDSNEDRAKAAKRAAADTMDLLVKPAHTSEETHQLSEEVSETLVNRFETYAAPYVYFGAHIGDGADFGFWPCEDSLSQAIADGKVLEIQQGDAIAQNLDVEHVVIRSPKGDELRCYKTGQTIWKV